MNIWDWRRIILIDEAAASKLELQEYYKWVAEQNTELLSNLASGCIESIRRFPSGQ